MFSKRIGIIDACHLKTYSRFSGAPAKSRVCSVGALRQKTLSTPPLLSGYRPGAHPRVASMSQLPAATRCYPPAYRFDSSGGDKPK